MKIDRRTLLGTGAVLIGATAPGVAFEAAAAQGKKAACTSGNALPNYAPPVVQVDAGQLRGFRDGKTAVFLGVPYATAERFELPKPVPPWQGVKSAQAWGPVCPIPPQRSVGSDEFVFPHRY